MPGIGLDNEDWLRGRSWDVWRVDSASRVTRLEELRLALGRDGIPDVEWVAQLARMTKLPFWEAAPRQLKDEAEAYLVAR